jgi:hypothetical protein
MFWWPGPPPCQPILATTWLTEAQGVMAGTRYIYSGVMFPLQCTTKVVSGGVMRRLLPRAATASRPRFPPPRRCVTRRARHPSTTGATAARVVCCPRRRPAGRLTRRGLWPGSRHGVLRLAGTTCITVAIVTKLLLLAHVLLWLLHDRTPATSTCSYFFVAVRCCV